MSSGADLTVPPVSEDQYEKQIIGYNPKRSSFQVKCALGVHLFVFLIFQLEYLPCFGKFG